MATLAGVTLSSSSPSTARAPLVTRASAVFWSGIPGTSFASGSAMVGDGILGLCTGASVAALVGDPAIETPRQVVAYQANPPTPCLAGEPMDHRGAWLPLQPEDGGDTLDRQFLYDVIDWLIE